MVGWGGVYGCRRIRDAGAVPTALTWGDVGPRGHVVGRGKGTGRRSRGLGTIKSRRELGC